MKGFVFCIGVNLCKVWLWFIVKFVLFGLMLLKLLLVDFVLNLMDRIVCKFGLKQKCYKMMFYNLCCVFLEMMEEECVKIVMDLWGLMGCMVVEYVYFDKLFDFDLVCEGKGWVEVFGILFFLEVCDFKGFFIIFIVYMVNFEMFFVVGNVFGFDVIVFFWLLNNFYMVEMIQDFWVSCMGLFVFLYVGLLFVFVWQFERGGGVGVFVDQKFLKGVDMMFFGVFVKINLLFVKFVWQFNCLVYLVCCIWFLGNCYWFELELVLVILCKVMGEVDVNVMVQLFNDIVECWVWEYLG